MSDFPDFVAELRRHLPVGPPNLVVVETVDSTNRLARSIAELYRQDELETPPVALVAWEQSAGRGRRGKTWHSPAGRGVWASLLLPGVTAADLSVLPLAAAVALCEALDAHLPSPCGLKWPNDLMTPGGKLGGLLVECGMGAAQVGDAIFGFGVNRDLEADELPTPGATSLAREGEAPALAALAAEVIDHLWAVLASRQGRQTAARRYARRSIHRLGEELRCQLASGTVTGTFAGFTDEGFLRLRVGGREEVVPAGEVIEG
ncbi:MAG TPA: biotin--[acetyl-CoA-carboxylase] ligase [Thermoanaerobaculia bacterium]|nr:biotin--[acetyl-CoA-carboxylase] ligase [Thermoanaerobaculia bacterium]